GGRNLLAKPLPEPDTALDLEVVGHNRPQLRMLTPRSGSALLICTALCRTADPSIFDHLGRPRRRNGGHHKGRRRRPAALTRARSAGNRYPPGMVISSESRDLAQVTSVSRHAAALTGPAAKGHRLRPEALDRRRVDPDATVDQFTPAHASRAVDRLNTAPDVLLIGEDRETVAHRVMITGVDAVVATVTRAPGRIVRVPSLRDPDHRRPRCNSVHPLECTELILPIPATIPTRAAKAVGRKKHGLGPPLPLACCGDIDDQDLGIPGMRIAAHPWQEALGAAPPAIPKVGGQVNETDTF